MRISKQLVSASVLAMLAGCSTLSSLNPFAKEPKDQPAKLVELQGSMAVRTAWKVNVGRASEGQFAPAVVGNTLVLAGGQGTIVRVDTATGNELWRVDAGVPLTAGVGTDGNVLVVGGAKGAVLAFDMNGKELWKAQASSEVLSTPAVGKGVVVVRSVDNRIVGLDALTGQQKWTVQRPSPPLSLRLAPGMLVVGDDVVVAQPGGKMLRMVLATGAPRWEISVGESRGATELERMIDMGGAPVLAGGDVCAVAYQGRIGCFEVDAATIRWTKEFSSDVGVAVDERFVFAVDDKGAVHTFNRENGASAWKNDKLAFRHPSTPVSYGRAVAVGDYQGYVHFMSREDGNFLARAATDGSAITGTPVVAGDKLIFQTQAGTVAAIAVE
ncbi:outer membrane protein assembly factor BamB [Pseudoduganella sp. GCM10020061]|uniref:outer membrane protein assembly factor BamB n=1 Tax=Pseudoduganella sp. GCM10020061 TaxID=3317345 RepID=UPI003627425A